MTLSKGDLLLKINREEYRTAGKFIPVQGEAYFLHEVLENVHYQGKLDNEGTPITFVEAKLKVIK